MALSSSDHMERYFIGYNHLLTEEKILKQVMVQLYLWK